MGDELRQDRRRGAERRVVQRCKIFTDCPRGLLRIDGIDVPLPLRARVHPRDIGSDQTGIDREPRAAHQPFLDAAGDDGLEKQTEQIAVAKLAVPVLRERGVIGHPAVKPKTTEPPVRQIQVDLSAEPTLRPDTGQVADQQHPHDQLRIDRGPPEMAVERA